MKEAATLAASVSSVERTPVPVTSKVDPVKKNTEAQNKPVDATAHDTSPSLYESASSMLHSASSHFPDIASAGSLLEKTAGALTTVDVKAGGKVDVDGTLTTKNTVTFAVDRNSILYAALSSFIAMELFRYINS